MRTLQTPYISGWLDNLLLLSVSILMGSLGDSSSHPLSLCFVGLPAMVSQCPPATAMRPTISLLQMLLSLTTEDLRGRFSGGVSGTCSYHRLHSQEDNAFPRIESGSFFCKGPESKSFQFCGSVNNYSSLQL